MVNLSDHRLCTRWYALSDPCQQPGPEADINHPPMYLDKRC